ncbi:MAG: T9SS type A sorting domain-containing protein [Cyclobacteriaceae bacterium]|nr:T9SS type A sorting domain-containing protein [Cyclobacteriaceae bacterium]
MECPHLGDGGYSAISRDGLYYYASFQFGKVYRFTLDKNLQRLTFARVDPQGSGGEDKLLFVNPYILAPENQNILYYAGGNIIWRNTNISQTPLFENHPAHINWQKLNGTEVNDGTISALAASYNPAGKLYYGTTNGRLFRIENVREKAYSVKEITATPFPSMAYISCIAIDRKNSNKLIVSFSNYNVISLFYSQDGGVSFANISGNLEENEDGSGGGASVRWVEIVSKEQGPAQVFAATSTGIYGTEELDGNNTQWQQHGSSTVGNALVTMIKYFAADGTIVAATHGNGMYEAYLDKVWATEISNADLPFTVSDPYPNPSGGQVTIPFTIPKDGMVRARIYSPLGQMVKTLLWSVQYRGKNVLVWDGTNEAGAPVASGTYICRLEYDTKKIGTRIVYLR